MDKISIIDNSDKVSQRSKESNKFYNNSLKYIYQRVKLPENP